MEAFIASQPPALQELWPTIPTYLQLDVLDLMRSDLPLATKVDACTRASKMTSQEEFIPFNPLLKSARDTADAAAEALLYKIEVSNLNFVCKFCKSKKTRAIVTGGRAADEATPVRIVCLACGKSSLE